MRNEFRSLRTEQLLSDYLFLKNFGPNAIKALSKNEASLWDRLVILTSSPGGGKSSLMRLFTPEVLQTLIRHSPSPHFSTLLEMLSEKLVIFEDGTPRTLGVMTSLSGSFNQIDSMGLSRPLANSIFNHLLDVSVGLSILQASMQLCSLSYPGQLDELSIDASKYYNLDGEVDGSIVETQLSSLERNMLERIDGYSSISSEPQLSAEFLPSTRLLRSGIICHDGKPIFDKAILMLDDIQWLAPTQIKYLLSSIIKRKLGAGIWVASRTEVFNPEESFPSGAKETRDYLFLDLEQYWKANRGLFRSTLEFVSDQRVASSNVSNIASFSECIGDDPLSEFSRNQIKAVLDSVRQSASEIGEKEMKKALGILMVESPSAYDKIVAYRAASIMYDRLKGGYQTRLDGSMLDLDAKVNVSQLRGAAELFLSDELNIPYYCGQYRIGSLSSYNFEQFLMVAGDIFEESKARVYVGKNPAVPAQRQHRIIRERSEERWKSIPLTIPNGIRVQSFLGNIGDFCFGETYQANAPYAPGVSGVGIDVNEFSRLMDRVANDKIIISKQTSLEEFIEEEVEESSSDILADTIHSCITNSLLEYSPTKQGGKNWIVLYLNRLFCVKFGLPLARGGWRSRRVADLRKWFENGR